MAKPGASNILEETYLTSMPTTEYVYTWVINDFSTWLENVEGEQKSSLFPSGELEEVQWELSFYPKSIQIIEYCALYLRLVSSKQDKLNARFQLAMKDSNGIVIAESSLQPENGFKREYCWGWNVFSKREQLLKMLKPSDKLLIWCKIIVNGEIENKTLKGNLVKQPEPIPSSLTKDLKSLVDGAKFGDVTMLVAGQRFLAHKCILSARSSVFNAMFEHQMQEGIENCVSIDDVKPEVFQELIRYIYTDEVTGLVTMGRDLYKAADKYDIPALKSLCRYSILEKLSWETGAETLIVADLHGDLEMKMRVLQFLSGSVAAKVTETDGWKELVRACPHLVDETIKAMAANMASSK